MAWQRDCNQDCCDRFFLTGDVWVYVLIPDDADAALFLVDELLSDASDGFSVSCCSSWVSSSSGFLIQEPSSIQQQSNPEQSQPMGRHQSHNQVAKHGQKWIRSPAKSLTIQEQSYPIQMGSFRNQENQFQYSAKKKQNPAALIRLFNL